MTQRVSDERLSDAIEIAIRQNLSDTLELALDIQDARAEIRELKFLAEYQDIELAKFHTLMRQGYEMLYRKGVNI